MGKAYLSDEGIRPLEKLLKTFCMKTGYSQDAVFEGLLDYMCSFLNPSFTPEPLQGWKYTKQDNETFYEMMVLTCRITGEQIIKKGWYDPFGDLYMSIHSNGGGKEQYFTPPAVASATAAVNLAGLKEPSGTRTPVGKRITISDPAGGSGRLALAAYCELLKVMQNEWHWSADKTEANRPFISVEDLDYNCVKMAALNICLHGAFGEAVCHDTLTEPDKVRMGFIVNESMWPFPTQVPSVRRESDPWRFVCTRQWMIQQQAKEQSQGSGDADCNHVAPASPLPDPVQAEAPKQEPKGKAVQLTFF